MFNTTELLIRSEGPHWSATAQCHHTTAEDLGDTVNPSWGFRGTTPKRILIFVLSSLPEDLFLNALIPNSQPRRQLNHG